MIGVGEDRLRALGAGEIGRHRLDRRLGGAEQEGRRLDRAVRRVEPAGARAAGGVVACDVEREAPWGGLGAGRGGRRGFGHPARASALAAAFLMRRLSFCASSGSFAVGVFSR